MVDSSIGVRIASLSSGLEKIFWRTLSILTCACSVANNSERGEWIDMKWELIQKYKLYCSLILSTLSTSTFYIFLLFILPLMTSCLFVSFLVRLNKASGEASSLQLVGSCSNSSRRGSISSVCGEGLVGEWPGPSGTKTVPSKLGNEESGSIR